MCTKSGHIARSAHIFKDLQFNDDTLSINAVHPYTSDYTVAVSAIIGTPDGTVYEAHEF